MKNIRKILYVCLGMLLISGCAKTPQVITTEPSELLDVSKLAVELTQMVKKGVPVATPFVNLNSAKVDLENIVGYDRFFMQNIVIVDVDYSFDGIYSQRMLVESVDKMGHIDLRNDRIAFTLRSPNSEEAASIGDGFQAYFSKDKFSQLSKNEKEALEVAISTYQQSNGLKADGKYGKDTAHSLAKQSSVVEILEITSGIVYPAEPRHATYIVPFSIVNQNPEQFYRGFESIGTVRQNSIEFEDFASVAKEGVQLTVFVYFFDRVDPYTPLSVRLSTSKLKATGSAGQRWYADPVKWPVLVETFTLNDDPKSLPGDLYLSVCIEDDESNRCISSRRVK